MFGFPPLEQGILLERSTRFLARVAVGRKVIEAFVPDSGRLPELLRPGVEVYLREAASRRARRTTHDLCLVRQGATLVAVDSRLPNQMVAEALREQALSWFCGYERVTPEPRVGRGRLDFHLSGPNRPDCYLEVKSCTLVQDGIGLFPDAPTARGVRHLEELTRLCSRGARAAVLFIIQREDANLLAPHARVDPLFARCLRQAVDSGVEAYALKCRVGLTGISLGEQVPVEVT